MGTKNPRQARYNLMQCTDLAGRPIEVTLTLFTCRAMGSAGSLIFLRGVFGLELPTRCSLDYGQALDDAAESAAIIDKGHKRSPL